MKTGIKRGYFYVIVSVVLALVIAAIMFPYMRIMQKNATAQCYAILDDSREKTSQVISNYMNNEKEHLEAAGRIIGKLVADSDANEQLILDVLSSSAGVKDYAHWEFCFPNGTLLKSDGTVGALGKKYSFEDRVSHEFVVSERRTALKDGKTQIIMLSNSLFDDRGKCIGILSSVMELEPFTQMLFSNMDMGKNQIVVFERGTGDILINSWNSELGNIEEYLEGDVAPYGNYKWHDIYLSYNVVNFSDWEIIFGSPEEVCMAASNVNRTSTFKLIWALFVIFAIYILGVFHSEKKRERKFLEREEELKFASNAKTLFLFNMSHDIRTPMNAIMGFSDLIAKNAGDEEKVSNYISKVQTANTYLLSLINNVLEMARIESGKLELDETICDCGKVFSNLYSVFELDIKNKGITFECNTDIKHNYVMCDVTKIREVMLNIISNSVKYTPAGGHITITTKEIPLDNNETTLFRTTISDDGIGISEKFLPTIFDEFTREKNSTQSGIEGTGLGMPITKKLVEIMHGSIYVESKLGKGTTFTIVIPHRIVADEEVEKNIKQVTVTAGENFSNCKILVAEDNDLNAEIAMELLGEAGFTVDRAVDGKDCLEKIIYAKPDEYQAILMDIQMPRMNGYDATIAIRSLEDPIKSGIPIIAMTANAFDEDRKNALKVGMNAHVPKPVDISVLLSVLAENIGIRS